MSQRKRRPHMGPLPVASIRRQIDSRSLPAHCPWAVFRGGAYLMEVGSILVTATLVSIVGAMALWIAE